MTYRILIRIETRVIKPGIGIAHTNCQRWSSRVLGEHISEIDIVYSEIGTAIRRIDWNRPTCGTSASERSILCGCHGQYTGKRIIEIGSTVCCTPVYSDLVLTSI